MNDELWKTRDEQATVTQLFDQDAGIVERVYTEDIGLELRPVIGKALDRFGTWIADLGWRER